MFSWIGFVWLVGLTAAGLVVTHGMFKKKNGKKIYEGKHVVVSGGSEGIGKELAMEFFRYGAKVTLLARTVSKLEKAKKEILSLKETDSSIPDSASVEFVSVDMTNYEKVCQGMKEAIKVQGGQEIYCLIVAAGRAVPGYFLDQDPKVFVDTMNINYFGCVYAAKAVVPMMIENKTRGQIVFISSAASCASFTGYSSYAPTKCAVRGLSDALRNELKGFGISIHIAYPPDTDTPGYEEENKSKPKETLEISPPEVYSAKSVVDCIMDGLLRGEYHLPSPDIVQNLLISTCVNITPRGRWAPVELLLAPVLGIATLLYKFHADRVAVQYGLRIETIQNK